MVTLLRGKTHTRGIQITCWSKKHGRYWNLAIDNRVSDCAFDFGTKKLRNLGGDVGGAIKNFKGAMKEDKKGEKKKVEDQGDSGRVIDAESKVEDKVEDKD